MFYSISDLLVGLRLSKKLIILYLKANIDKVLRPTRFDVEPSEENSTKCWLHWLATFENFLGDNRSRKSLQT